MPDRDSFVSWIKSYVIVLLIAATGVVWVTVFFEPSDDSNSANVVLRDEVAQNILRLVFITIAGIIVKLLLDRHVAEQQRKSQERERKIELLNGLTACHLRTLQALETIEVYKSASAYRDQMGAINVIRIELEQYIDQVESEYPAIKRRNELVPYLVSLDSNLTQLTREWEREYLNIARVQIVDERKTDQYKKEAHKDERLKRGRYRSVPKLLQGLDILGTMQREDYEDIRNDFKAATQLVRNDLGSGDAQVTGSDVPSPTLFAGKLVTDPIQTDSRRDGNPTLTAQLQVRQGRNNCTYSATFHGTDCEVIENLGVDQKILVKGYVSKSRDDRQLDALSVKKICTQPGATRIVGIARRALTK